MPFFLPRLESKLTESIYLYSLDSVLNSQGDYLERTHNGIEQLHVVALRYPRKKTQSRNPDTIVYLGIGVCTKCAEIPPQSIDEH